MFPTLVLTPSGGKILLRKWGDIAQFEPHPIYSAKIYLPKSLTNAFTMSGLTTRGSGGDHFLSGEHKNFHIADPDFKDSFESYFEKLWMINFGQS